MVQQLTNPAVSGTPPRMTYEEFLAWTADHPHAEWVDGEVIEFMPVTGRHSLIVVFWIELLRSYLRLRRLGLLVAEPYAMLIRGGRAHRLPDIAVILTANLHRFTENHLDGPADLVVEVLSEESVDRDRRVKLEEYAA